MTNVRRTQEINALGGSVFVYVLLDPNGDLSNVFLADDDEGAWCIATGWVEQHEINSIKDAGWRVVRGTIEWVA